MKVLLVRPGPSFSVQDVAFGWRAGLREHGVLVGDLNYDDRLDFFLSAHVDKNATGEFVRAFSDEAGVREAAKGIETVCYEWWPDVVMFVQGSLVPPETLAVIQAHRHHVVLLCTESPYEDDHQADLAKYADTVILNDPANLDWFRSRHHDVHYVPHAYRPELHHPGPAIPELACDFAFVGTGFPSRRELLEQVDLEGLDVILGGCWVGAEDSPLVKHLAHDVGCCMDNETTADVYRSTRSSLNYYRREHHDSEHGTAEGVAMGPREIELAACGTFFLRDPRPEGDEVLPMLPTFSEPGEVRPLLDWWLAHDNEREEVTRQARAAVADRTFANNARWLLRHLEKGN